ncbi:hypothetical protein KQH54_03190 [bacterium]|nr:hypothetical protein [bacterium]
MEPTLEDLRLQALFLIQRLERISADSVWAHQVSGVRGALLRYMEDWQTGVSDLPKLRMLLETGYFYLYKAAKEIPEDFE